jgi:ADP-ribose pyrophosphatase YjhB (NUDIX family)
MTDRFKVIIAVHLFLRQDNKILLMRRFNTGYEDGNYSVPAGHIDGGETITNAMIREAKEELTIHIEHDDLKVVHIMHRNADDWERIDFFLECKKWEGDIQIGEPDKCDNLEWIDDLDSLPENTIPYIRSAIEHYREDQHFSEFNWE